MHRVFVAWDATEARRFLAVLDGHGIRGRVIEDREFPDKGMLHDTEGAPEVWIHDEARVAEALGLASEFESRRPGPGDVSGDGSGDAGDAAGEGPAPGTKRPSPS